MSSSSLAYTISEYRQEDFQSAADYISYIIKQKQGWTCRAQIENDRYRQYHYGYNEILAQSFAGQKNVYISMNTFFKPKRLRTNIKHLNALYVDLDIYNKGLSKEKALERLERLFQGVLPRPTFIIDSGRGLYCIWSIDEDRNALPRWERVMDWLYSKLEHLGADSACNDVTRILRVPTTINTKSSSDVKIISFNPEKYTLHKIISEYNIKSSKPYQTSILSYGYGKATAKQRKYASELAKQNNVQEPDYSNFEETFSFIAHYSAISAPVRKPSVNNLVDFSRYKAMPIIQGRMRDIAYLFTYLRKGSDCKREIALFVYRLLAIQAYGYNYEKALKATLELNSKLDCPLPEKYVIKRTFSAEKRIKDGENYCYKTATLLRILEITEEEAEKLCFLNYSSGYSRENKRTRNREAYLLRLESAGKQTKEELLKERRNKLKFLIDNGFSRAEICNKLNISVATYARDKAALKVAAAGEHERSVNVFKSQYIVTQHSNANAAVRHLNAPKRIQKKAVSVKLFSFFNKGISKIQPPIYMELAPATRRASNLKKIRMADLALEENINDFLGFSNRKVYLC